MNTHFDCPVLNDSMLQLIARQHPTCATEIINALSTCPPEMSVLTLVIMHINELQSGKGNTP